MFTRLETKNLRKFIDNYENIYTAGFEKYISDDNKSKF